MYKYLKETRKKQIYIRVENFTKPAIFRLHCGLY